MAVLERGGNAFDAAVAAGFTLQVVEPHLNGPGGDLPAIFWPASLGRPVVLCAQGVAPAAATIERMRALGHDLVPGTGPLAACVPGRLRRLAPPPAGVRDVAARGRARLRDRLRRVRLSRRRRDHVHDRARRVAAPRVARVRGALPARAAAGDDVPQPAARSDVEAAARGVARRLARGRDRARADGVLRGLRRAGDRRLLARERRAADRRRPARVARDARGAGDLRLPRAHRLQDRRRGARGPSACSSSRSSPASTSRT